MKSTIKTIDPSDISTPELYHYLSAAIAPRPICFASTIDKSGNVNLSPFSFFNVFSTNPPILVFSPVRRGRDGSSKDTFTNIIEVKETVINIVNFPMVEQMSLSSTEYDKDVNEFVKAGFTEVKSEIVKPPRVGESPVAFECIIDQVIELGNTGGAGNLVIARVVLLHINEQYIDTTGKLDTAALDLVGRMGGSSYCRANGHALFEIPKPIHSKGIGIDQLPQSIRESHILTGNNLGRLGNVERLPEESEILNIKEQADVKRLLDQVTETPSLKRELELLAQQWLENGETTKALQLLLLNDTFV